MDKTLTRLDLIVSLISTIVTVIAVSAFSFGLLRAEISLATAGVSTLRDDLKGLEQVSNERYQDTRDRLVRLEAKGGK